MSKLEAEILNNPEKTELKDTEKEVANFESKNQLSDEDKFLKSFDVAPSQRLDMRDFIDSLKNLDHSLYHSISASEKFTPNFLRSEYVRDLVQKKAYNEAVVQKNSFGPEKFAKAINIFGIDESFFKQDDFAKLKQDNWLDRLKNGGKIDDRNNYDASNNWGNEPSAEELALAVKEEEINYGNFKESGLDINSPEVKTAALKGISYLAINSDFLFSMAHEKATVDDYKEYFKITDSELQETIINALKDKGFSDTKINDNLRKKYSFVDDFLKSDEALLLVKQEVEKGLVNSNSVQGVMQYFSLTDSDLDQPKIKEQQKEQAVNSLLKGLQDVENGRNSFLFYDMERAAKFLSKEEWQDIFSKYDNENLVSAIAYGLQYSWKLEDSLAFFREIGLPEKIFKAGSIELIANQTGDHNNFRVDKIKELQSATGLSDQELAEGFSIGMVRALDHGLNEYKLESMKRDMDIAEMLDSPKLQTELKQLYLKRISTASISDLEKLDENFDVKWQAEDRPARFASLKTALTSNYTLSSFTSRKKMKEFVDHNHPGTHKLFFLADPEIKQAVSKMLEQVPFSGSYITYESDIITNLSNYFNVSKDDIVEQIKAKIDNGRFVHERTDSGSFKKYVPEIDLRQENDKCLQNYGERIIDKALEHKNWPTIKAIQNYNNPESSQIIYNFLTEQEANLIDENKSPEIRKYAVEALANLSKGIEYLEVNYFSDLVKIYTNTDAASLLDLFKRRNSLLPVLEDKDKEAMFDCLISNSSKLDNVISTIISKDVITDLTADQANKVFESGNFRGAMVGLAGAEANQKNIPAYLYDELYSKLINKQDEKIKHKSTDDFTSSINELLKIGNKDSNLINLIQNKSLLDELASNPGAIDKVKQITESLSGPLLINQWSFIYNQLKDSSAEDFERKINIINRLDPHLSSWWLSQIPFNDLFSRLEASTAEQQETFFETVNLAKLPVTDFTEKNWLQNLVRYVSVAEDYNVVRLNASDKETVTKEFSGSYRDVVLTKIEEQLTTFLQNDASNSMPLELVMTSKVIDEAGGAGNLKYVEALGGIILKLKNTFENKKVTIKTKSEISSLLLKQDERMNKEKWLQDDKAEFRNLSSDIIEAAPSLYTAFGPLLDQLNPKEVKIFLNENLPLYQARLVTIQEIKGDDNTHYNPRDLVLIRDGIKKLAADLNSGSENRDTYLKNDKLRLIEEIKTDFKSRFNIEKVPDQFSNGNLRSIQNTIRYLGNISGRSMSHEAIISFYLGLKLNGDWDKFRQGQDIKLEEYLSGKQLQTLRPIIEKKNQSYNLPLEVAGIAPEKAQKFQELLQAEVSNSMVGNIATIDVKLDTLKRSLKELADPDIYEKNTEKEVMKLLLTDGKLVNATLAKIFGSLSGKNIELSDQENLMKTRLELIYQVGDWNQNQVELIQQEIQPLSSVSNVINKLEEENVDQNIEDLHKKIDPSGEIVEIFNSLGEDFKPESGALALSRDLSYLENLMVKNGDKLSAEDQEKAKNYLDSVKGKMIELESTMSRVKDYFVKMSKSKHLEKHTLLKNRLAEIEKVINSDQDNSMIISHLTKDLDSVIENMRQCLGCLRKEINNDTNLSFGDYNKFFMFNQSNKEKGSVADEIVFFLPVKNNNGQTEMSFVMDRVYGSSTPDYLVSNIATLFKKYQSIKKEMPEAKISITVSDAALSSVGFNHELLVGKLKEVLPDARLTERTKELVANIAESALSDNYVEFSDGGARSFGDKPFSGTVIY
ncbi:MAG: hypothetical protein WAW11_01240 [Patescibacteria group bacterium]